MSKHPLSEAEVDALVDEIQDRLGDSTARTYGRRGVLAALGVAALGTGSASAQASGAVGTASNPVDVEGFDVTASNSFEDPAGVTHSGELADASDVGSGTGQWQELNSGSNIEPIDGETIGSGSEDVDVGSLSTDKQNTNARVVPQFGSLQAAHDDLPADGGVIYLTENIAETNVTITKPVKLSGYGVGRRDGTGRHVDTAGGDGVEVLADDVVIEDLSFIGNGTSYCLKIGQSGDVVADTVLRDVTARNGLNSFVAEGGMSNADWDLSVKASANDNIVFDLSGDSSDFINANEFSLSSINAGNHGILIDGTGGGARKFSGNTIQNVWVGNAGGDAFRTEGAFEFRGNLIDGYGFENNSGDDLNVTGLASGSQNNRLHIQIGSNLTYDKSDWETLRSITNPGLTGKFGFQIDDGVESFKGGTITRTVSGADPQDPILVWWRYNGNNGSCHVRFNGFRLNSSGELEVVFEELENNNVADIRWFAYEFST